MIKCKLEHHLFLKVSFLFIISLQLEKRIWGKPRISVQLKINFVINIKNLFLSVNESYYLWCHLKKFQIAQMRSSMDDLFLTIWR